MMKFSSLTLILKNDFAAQKPELFIVLDVLCEFCPPLFCSPLY